MKSNDVLKLLDAGFSKDEILAMDKPAETQTKATNEELAEIIAKATQTKTEPVDEKKDSELDLVKQLLSGINLNQVVEQPKEDADDKGVTLSDEQFKLLLQSSNLANRTVDLPKEDSWREAFNKHAEEVLGATTTKEV